MCNLKEFILDNLYILIINPLRNLKNHTKWFFQRIRRGFDDREIWNIDTTFYKWLLPRLKLFAKRIICYPENYKSMSAWQKELVNRVTQLELIVTYSCNEHNFPDFKRYLTLKELGEYRKTMNENQIKYIAFEKCIENFNKWFSKNINDLWY